MEVKGMYDVKKEFTLAEIKEMLAKLGAFIQSNLQKKWSVVDTINSCKTGQDVLNVLEQWG